MSETEPCLDDNGENNEFFFESDHLALRGNKDYKAMLRLILLLENQKILLIKDVENLAIEQQKALDDPLEFLDNLKNGKIEFPLSHSIPNLPEINWSQYGMEDFKIEDWKQSSVESGTEKSDNILIRGRAFNQSKPETFNQLWTCKEQRRLEELLKEYPAEEIESRRWHKIAAALGNRTAKQVMSRVQKYFLKLQRAGLPVPGRVPRNLPAKISHRHQRNNKYYHKRSTFFPAEDVPVFMDDSMNQTEYKTEPRVLEQWTPLELMEAVYKRRKIEEKSTTPLYTHMGISCIGCNCESIIGTRWTDGEGSDWCSDCLIIFQPTNKLIPFDNLVVEDNTEQSSSQF